MKKWIFVLFSVGIFASITNAQSITLNNQPSALLTNSLTISQSELTLNIGSLTTTAVENGSQIQLPDQLFPGQGVISGPDMTVLPVYTILLAVPENCRLSMTILDDQTIDMPNFKLAGTDEEEKQWINRTILSKGAYPDKLYDFVYVGKMRDINIARLTLYPVQYDPKSKLLRVHHHINLIAHHEGGEIIPAGSKISEAFRPIYEAFITNASLLNPSVVARGQYWFIVHDNFVQSISQLADWEKAKGYSVRVIPLSTIGFNPSSTMIYNYIRSQYNSAMVKPDYICLVGDTQISGGGIFATYTYNNPFGFGTIDSDNYFTFLVGDDYFPDVLIGRISIATAQELTNYKAKYFGYERNPYMDDTVWYHQATVVAGSDGGSVYSTRMTKLWCREIMLDHGYTSVDTFFVTQGSPGPNVEITASISRGATYVNYRGYGMADTWSPPYYGVWDLAGLTNGPKYGIMHSIVCGTGDFNDGPVPNCFGETWIRLSNRGGPGFIGNTNHDAHTRWTNALDCGIYWGLFQAGASTLAQSQLAGKMNVYFSFPEFTAPGEEVELYFNSYNDLGNPELNCWTGVPRQFQIAFPETLGIGRSGVDAVVTNQSGNPLENAYVCLWKGEEVFDGQFTAINGHAYFQINPSTIGQVKVTATMPSYTPYENAIQIVNMSLMVGLRGYRVDDDSIGDSRGNNDGQINPGETIELTPVVQNYGNSLTALGVQAQITSNNEFINIQSGNAGFGDIACGDSAASTQPLVMQIADDTPDKYSARLALDISATGGGSWRNVMVLPIIAPDINITATLIQNDNNDNHRLDPGESAQLVLTLANQGSEIMRSAQAILRCSDSLVQIADSLGQFGDIDIDSSAINLTDPFVVSVSNRAYVGHKINFVALVTGFGNIVRTLPFSVNIGTVNTDDPLGPDTYGYFCFDNTDMSYPYHPTYNWVPIDLSWNQIFIDDDEIVTINMPFPIKYYGRTYTQAIVSDNGYIAFGPTSWSNFFNAQIPGPQCAKAMVAPFWDDLSGGGGSTPLRIWYKYDQANGRFLIGWRNVFVNDIYQWLTLQIIFLDAAVWPTRTGDNEIIFQYNPATDCYSNSVGICNEDRTIGLQYMFNTILDLSSPVIETGRALKFTTGSAYVDIADEPGGRLPNSYSLAQNYPNPFNSTTLIQYYLPSAGDISLDIFDILGRKIRTLAKGEQPAGPGSCSWDGTSETGSQVSSGVYFYRLKAGQSDAIKRMLLMK
jgi:hypothetical protein